MATDNKQSGVIHGGSDGGVSGSHPESAPLEFAVAPATGNEVDTVRLRIVPIACWRVEDIRFAFDSSFVTSDVTTELRLLVSLRETHKQANPITREIQYPPLSVFGHADPVGTDDYNKSLSGRRATAVYAVLIANSEPSTAVSLWQKVAQAENWGANQRQAMQSATNLPAGTSDSGLFKAYLKPSARRNCNWRPRIFSPRAPIPAAKAIIRAAASSTRCSFFPTGGEQLRSSLRQERAQPGQRAEPACHGPAVSARQSGSSFPLALPPRHRREGGLYQTILVRRRKAPRYSTGNRRKKICRYPRHLCLPLL